ncbi:MAG: restriction endonuclease, partial [Caulobacteraceae bacterium]
LLTTCPSKINVADLKIFAEFRDFQTAKATGPAPPTEPRLSALTSAIEEAASNIEGTPEETIQVAELQIAESLRAELIGRIGEMSPAFFEQLVVDLIVAMGYGGSRSNVAKRIGQAGDEGIDGIVNEDPLGLDVVYIQAKRYAPGNTISRERIQQFIGALVGQGANRGVFFTTSSFTKHAAEYAAKVPQRVILIDGDQLARLMLQYGLGVRTERTVEIRRLDDAYFNPDAD